MTEEEFNRYQEAVEIKDKINKIKKELDYINSNFYDFVKIYPRTESNWALSIIINDSPKTITLDSDLFWEFIDIIKYKTQEKLNDLETQFKNL